MTENCTPDDATRKWFFAKALNHKERELRCRQMTESLSGYEKVVLDVHVGRFPDSRVRYIDT